MALILLFARLVGAEEIHVITSGGFTAAYLQLVPEFERATGHKVITTFGGSMGNGPETIPNRLARHEPADIVILASEALDDLIAKKQVVAGSRVDLVRSSIGMVVKAGAPKPDISNVAALTQTLLRAKSIAYSASASGVYLSTELFQRLGVADRVLPKSKNAQGERVAALVARGDADIGFQQISELLPEPGVDYVGPLPPGAQRVTIFSAGIVEGAAQPAAAKALIDFFVSPAATAAITKSGLEPATTDATKPSDAPSAAFDVVSVKPNASIEANGRLIVSPGMFRGSNVSAYSLIRTAFGEGRGLLKDQIVGAPEWITAERYDVIGRAGANLRSLATAAPLLRQLLEDRFQLRVHRETRQLSVFALRRVKPDGPLGPAMRRSSLDCDTLLKGSHPPITPSKSASWCGSRFEDGSILMGGYAIRSLISSLSATVEKIVVDDTGLTGAFDMDLEWNQDAAASDKPSLFTALQEQLGLKLVPTTAAVDVVVIDSVQHPSPD